MKTLKQLCILVIGIALIGSCKKTAEQEQVTQSRLPADRPHETISLRRAHDMYKAYNARFNALTEFRNGKEDARYGWHSIDFYKNYIAYLEYEARKVNIKISGLRLYYVAYPDNQPSQEYADYQTYIFVPTYYDSSTKQHIAFDPLHVRDGKPLPIHEIITKGSLSKNGGDDGHEGADDIPAGPSSVANMAEMCEPFCPEK
jgi:hypothetical protein